MKRYIVTSICIILLAACIHLPAGKNPHLNKNSLTQEDLSAAESILIHSHDYQGLAEFYKGNLKKKDTLEMRLKLAKNYLTMHDADSAVFYLQPLAERGTSNSSELYFVLAKAYYESHDNINAAHNAQRAIELDSQNGAAFNLLGIIYSSQMEIEKSRQYFTQARAVYFDDIKVKNNLAMLNIMQGKYNQALQQLVSLYRLEPEDKVIKTNLLLVLAKRKDYDSFYRLLDQDLKDGEIYQLYMAFSEMKMKELGKFSVTTSAQAVK